MKYRCLKQTPDVHKSGFGTVLSFAEIYKVRTPQKFQCVLSVKHYIGLAEVGSPSHLLINAIWRKLGVYQSQLHSQTVANNGFFPNLHLTSTTMKYRCLKQTPDVHKSGFGTVLSFIKIYIVKKKIPHCQLSII